MQAAVMDVMDGPEFELELEELPPPQALSAIASNDTPTAWFAQKRPCFLVPQCSETPMRNATSNNATAGLQIRMLPDRLCIPARSEDDTLPLGPWSIPA
jgi:hypothetical protein